MVTKINYPGLRFKPLCKTETVNSLPESKNADIYVICQAKYLPILQADTFRSAGRCQSAPSYTCKSYVI